MSKRPSPEAWEGLLNGLSLLREMATSIAASAMEFRRDLERQGWSEGPAELMAAEYYRAAMLASTSQEG